MVRVTARKLTRTSEGRKAGNEAIQLLISVSVVLQLLSFLGVDESRPRDGVARRFRSDENQFSFLSVVANDRKQEPREEKPDEHCSS